MSTKAGRPTKFNEELKEKALHYIENFQEYGDIVPSIEALALELGVHRSTLHDWATNKDHPFSDILEKCNQRQVRVLFNGSLSGGMNAQITKLMLGKQGYSEKLEQDHTSSDGTMTPKSNSDAVLAAIAAKHASDDT